MTQVTTASSNKTGGSYSSNQILSLDNQSLIDGGFWPKIYKRYGKAYGITDILTAGGNVVNIPSQDQKVVEELAPTRPLRIKTAISTGSAGDAITIELHADNFVNNKSIARVGFVLRIPQKYMPDGVREDREYKITAIGDGDLTNSSLTCEPLSADGTSKTASQIAYAVPADTYLYVGHSVYSRGEGQPEGTVTYPVTRTYKSGIIKNTKTFDGGFLAHKAETIELDGHLFDISKASADAEWELKEQKEDAFIYSEENDNTALIATSTFGAASGANRSTKGLFPWLDEAGQSIYYSDAFTFNYLDQVIDSLISQGVYTNSATIFCSLRFAQDLYKEAKDYLREYSGGTNLWDSVSGKVGFTPKCIEYGGMMFYIHPVASFSKPGSHGYVDSNDDNQYVAGTAAVVIPDAKVTVNEWGMEANVTIPNLSLGYVNRNGENRRNVMGRLLGMNGVFDSIDVASAADGYQLMWMSEFMLVGAEWNKMVFLRKQVAKAS